MSTGKSSQRISANLIIALLIAIVAIVITLQNTQMVTLHFLMWKVEASLILLLALNFLAGALLIYVLMLLQVQKLKRENRKLRKNKIEKKGNADSTMPPIS